MASDSMRRIAPEDLLLLGGDLVATGPDQPDQGDAGPPRCQLCDGAGYYTEPVRYNHPNFGVLFPCRCRIAATEAQARRDLERFSNLEHFADKTFDTFDAYSPSLVAAQARAREYARRPSGWLILFGNYGCGKTHLAAAIANAVVARGAKAFFGTVPEILDHLRSTFGPDSQVEYDDLFERVRDVPLLVLDDLGTEAATPWAREKLFQITNHRYNLALTTVITSNRRPTDIDGRIWSRMSDRVLGGGGPVQIDAPDFRGLSDQERAKLRVQAVALRRAAQRQAVVPQPRGAKSEPNGDPSAT